MAQDQRNRLTTNVDIPKAGMKKVSEYDNHTRCPFSTHLGVKALRLSQAGVCHKPEAYRFTQRIC